MFSERVKTMSGNNEMIQDFYFHQAQCTDQQVGQFMVLRTGHGYAGRMIVGKNDACRVVMKCRTHNFAGVNISAGKRTAKHFLA